MEMLAAIAMPAHMERQRLGEGGRIDPRTLERLGKLDDRLRLGAALAWWR